MFVSICNIVCVYISSLCPHDEGNLGNGVIFLGKLRDFKVRCKPACFCTKIRVFCWTKNQDKKYDKGQKSFLKFLKMF